MSPKSSAYKRVTITPPRVPVNPDQQQQTSQGSQTSGKIGSWRINGPVIAAGGITLDASKPYLLMNDGTTNRLLLGEDGT